MIHPPHDTELSRRRTIWQPVEIVPHYETSEWRKSLLSITSCCNPRLSLKLPCGMEQQVGIYKVRGQRERNNCSVLKAPIKHSRFAQLWYTTRPQDVKSNLEPTHGNTRNGGIWGSSELFSRKKGEKFFPPQNIRAADNTMGVCGASRRLGDVFNSAKILQLKQK